MEEQNSNNSKQGAQGAPDPARLIKPLRLELQQGCLDKAASGGLEAYLQRWGGALGVRFKGYAKMAPEARKQLVVESLTSLAMAPAVPKEPPKKSLAAPKATAPKITVATSGVALPRVHRQPDDAAAELPAIGPKRAAALRSMGIHTLEDLLYHSPRAWQDRSRLKPIAQLVEGELATVQGRILSSVNFRTRTRRKSPSRTGPRRSSSGSARKRRRWKPTGCSCWPGGANLRSAA
jgi:predicted flap endonuclease-1-like 5' DNA nuclease